jgi:hypothetical protein
MRSYQAGLIVSLVALKLVACSASEPSKPFSGTSSGGSGVVIPGGGGAGPSFGGALMGTAGDPVLDLSSGGTATSADSGTSCGIRQKPEEVFVYSPVALYLMQDISSSMVGTLGDPNSWPNSMTSVTSFVQDPSSAGLDVGLAVFGDLATSAMCDGSDCGKPVVEIGPLPANAQAIVSGMQSKTPPACCNFTPTECALRGMINHCLEWKQKTNEQCAAILVTDGAPSTCELNADNLAKIVADGKAQGVSTFTLGLPGSNIAFLDQLAQAGGSGKAVDVSGGSAAFIAALNAIRNKVSIGTPLPCAWKIPPPPQGQVFDAQKVNVSFVPKGGASQDFGYVTQADCARATNAWYFDDPNAPTQVLACPTTCDMLKAATGAEVNVAFGCARKPARLD